MLSFYLSLIDDESQFGTFEKIYSTYRKQMMYLAKLYMKSDFDAEDVVHDVFVRVATRHMSFISNLKTSEDVRNYLLKATKNTALNKLKRKERCNIAIESVSENELNGYSDMKDDAFVELICTKAEYKDVVQALISMDEPYRDIMYYHFVMEMSVSDAAKHLGRNASTAKKQLVRGKKILLNKLRSGGKDNVNDEG